MPPTEKHFESHIARTGKDYVGLHRWLDDAEHKNERHDFTRIWDFGPQLAGQFGADKVEEYIEHLREDMENAFDYFGIKRKEG